MRSSPPASTATRWPTSPSSGDHHAGGNRPISGDHHAGGNRRSRVITTPARRLPAHVVGAERAVEHGGVRDPSDPVGRRRPARIVIPRRRRRPRPPRSRWTRIRRSGCGPRPSHPGSGREMPHRSWCPPRSPRRRGLPSPTDRGSVNPRGGRILRRAAQRLRSACAGAVASQRWPPPPHAPPGAAGRSPSLAYERRLWDAGKDVVVGVDEVGRGAWAGPLTVGAAVLPRDRRVLTRCGIPSSSPSGSGKRCSTASPGGADAWGVGHASPEECDELGMSEAQRLAAPAGLRAVGRGARPGAARRQAGLCGRRHRRPVGAGRLRGACRSRRRRSSPR